METKKCLFCANDIPKEARKCSHCMEWQEEENISFQFHREVAVGNTEPPETKEPFQLRILKSIPIKNYVVRVLIVCIALFVILQVSWFMLNEDKIYLVSFALFTIQMIITWSGLIWIYYMIRRHFKHFVGISADTLEDTSTEFQQAMSKIFQPGAAIITGILFGLIAAVGEGIFVGTEFKTQDAKIAFGIFEFINMFFAGAGIYSILVFAAYLHRFSSKASKAKIKKNISNGANAIGKLHIKSSLLAIVPLFLGVVAKLFGDWLWDPLVIVWYSASAVAIIVYIFWPIIHVHRLLLKEKEKHLAIIHKRIDQVEMMINTAPSSRNYTRLFQLKEIEKSASNLNTWPFDTHSISAAFIAVVIPIVLMIIELILMGNGRKLIEFVMF